MLQYLSNFLDHLKLRIKGWNPLFYFYADCTTKEHNDKFPSIEIFQLVKKIQWQSYNIANCNFCGTNESKSLLTTAACAGNRQICVLPPMRILLFKMQS